MTASKVPEAGAFGTAEKKVKLLEQQRMEVSGQTGRSGNTPLPARDQRDKAPPGCLVSIGLRSWRVIVETIEPSAHGISVCPLWIDHRDH